MDASILEELYRIPQVRDAMREEMGGEQALKDSVIVLLDSPTEAVVYISSDDQTWYWKQGVGCEEISIAPYLEWIEEKNRESPGRYEFLFSVRDEDGDIRHLCREHKPEPLHPKFIEIMERLREIPEEERINNPKHGHLMTEALRYAPGWLQDAMTAKIKELDLMPEPTHYTEDGQPLISAQALAEKHGIPVEEVIRRAKEFSAGEEGLVLQIDPSQLHRKH